MRLLKLAKSILCASVLSIAALGCEGPSSDESNITDVPQTDVERQSIGNCWLYATASWVESMHLSATGEKFDISQSYWTYWHWYDEITQFRGSEIETGGSESVSFDIIRERGLMLESDFLPEDSVSEMSSRQASALAKMNEELKSGRLKTSKNRGNHKLVRQVLSEAWGLSSDVKAQLDKAFGTTGKKKFNTTASSFGTKIIEASDFAVRYTERQTDPNAPTVVDTTLVEAVDAWSTEFYPFDASSRRQYQIRVQKALHDRQPVIMTWSVDFNAMEGAPGAKQGSFNLDTLKAAGGPGRQGGHMVVMEDYQAITKDFGTLKAGVTLDPTKATDKAKLDAALKTDTTLEFWRIKNSWGAFRDDRSSAPGFPGYHDLYQTYLDGPITWCPSVEETKTEDNCTGSTEPFENTILPPGY
ncbi:MAG: hypothetical protein HOV80_31975 [Polyangiaceae bacterium]|nr:hypothetical protein [Polyangiaceae bacterium]